LTAINAVPSQERITHIAPQALLAVLHDSHNAWPAAQEMALYDRIKSALGDVAGVDRMARSHARLAAAAMYLLCNGNSEQRGEIESYIFLHLVHELRFVCASHTMLHRCATTWQVERHSTKLSVENKHPLHVG